ncbi:hypothetical protein TRFO_25396 [Tritrichomonas foetus]|uniref:Bromo domain-containing protein n=1 Tax=Tritrichomonas foetus TaxID=1144522 RepID=A0A1J4K6Q5_9EUKA|nr:hypothetical protein TRFO_25396 [Tritrichomonas foetus]|eukprot:OHT06576.1 hypothetical protein TRFO_25396 [Tritrichomonas foetus]
MSHDLCCGKCNHLYVNFPKQTNYSMAYKINERGLSDVPKEGEFSPALKTMAIELMDKILEFRPISIIHSQLGGTPMNDIKENLFLNSYKTLSDWRNEFETILNKIDELNNPQLTDISAELKLIFDKRYHDLEVFSQYHFRDYYDNILREIADINDKYISQNS